MAVEQNGSGWEEHVQEIINTLKGVPEPPADWTLPFIPWRGEGYSQAPVRILFVGKSVGCFNDPDALNWATPFQDWKSSGHPEPASVTRDYVTTKVAKFKTARPEFWMVPLLITSAFVPASMEPGQVVNSLAWSNLYKVCFAGRASGNGLPNRRDLQCTCSPERGFCLRHDSAEWLTREIDILQPHLVLLGIRECWDDLADALALACDSQCDLPLKLGDADMEKWSNRGLNHKPNGVWVTNHFSAWSGRASHGRVLLEMKKAISASEPSPGH